MAQNYKVLGQESPGANTDSALYTVPALTQAVCSTLAICNRGTSTTYRVSVRPNGASLVNKHYIVYDAAIESNTSNMLTLGISLSSNDIVSVEAGSANVSFSIFGVEIS